MTCLCPARWTLNGNIISTTINITAINQPVSIMLPPASQTRRRKPAWRHPGRGRSQGDRRMRRRTGGRPTADPGRQLPGHSRRLPRTRGRFDHEQQRCAHGWPSACPTKGGRLGDRTRRNRSAGLAFNTATALSCSFEGSFSAWWWSLSPQSWTGCTSGSRAGSRAPSRRTRTRLVLVPLAPATPVPGAVVPLPATRLRIHLGVR